MEAERRLWSAVLLQAFEDLRDETFGSILYNQAAAFFFSPGWRESRQNVCDLLGLAIEEIRRPALRILNARRLERGLPALQPTPVMSGPGLRPARAPAAGAMRVTLPRLVAEFKPEPERTRRAGGWRKRYDYNPFDPFKPLPSETRAA